MDSEARGGNMQGFWDYLNRFSLVLSILISLGTIVATITLSWVYLVLGTLAFGVIIFTTTHRGRHLAGGMWVRIRSWHSWSQLIGWWRSLPARITRFFIFTWLILREIYRAKWTFLFLCFAFMLAGWGLCEGVCWTLINVFGDFISSLDGNTHLVLIFITTSLGMCVGIGIGVGFALKSFLAPQRTFSFGRLMAWSILGTTILGPGVTGLGVLLVNYGHFLYSLQSVSQFTGERYYPDDQPNPYWIAAEIGAVIGLCGIGLLIAFISVVSVKNELASEKEKRELEKAENENYSI